MEKAEKIKRCPFRTILNSNIGMVCGKECSLYIERTYYYDDGDYRQEKGCAFKIIAEKMMDRE